MARSATETRSRILTAAGNLFSSHGYCGTSLDDIVTAAGITKGAFYHYFKSKEEVCLTLLDQALAQTGRLLEVSSAADPLESLRIWARRIVDPEQSEISNMFRLVLRLSGDLPLFSDPIPDKIRRFWNEQAGCLEVLIAACPSRNPACKDAHQAALLILSAFIGALRLSQNRVPDMEADQLLEIVINLILQ
jgi:AcrR family transcriptional regulator